MKRIALALLCLILAMTLAGCATVNSDNSFQGQAPSGVEQSVTVQQNDAEPTAVPTSDPNTAGYNG